ncbi:MAG TPA: glutathione peroxidase [Xanthomonadales bacterium]|nr:glutathione peroxidase [Xanthomonadales bacterium]
MHAWACSDLLDREFRPLAGKEPVNLCAKFAGQVLLVVNTASKCGFTPQYEGLEALNAKYSARGFAVLGFPSNDFLWQEPGTEAEIREFCTLTYGVDFPMFEKVRVREGKANAFFDALAAQAGGEYPSWNFHKYLLDRSGKVVATFGSRTEPDDPDVVAAIEKLLAQPIESGER